MFSITKPVRRSFSNFPCWVQNKKLKRVSCTGINPVNNLVKGKMGIDYLADSRLQGLKNMSQT